MSRPVFVLLLGCLLLPSCPAWAQLPAQGLFARTNLVAWCIVPFDTKKRGPEERAEMLDRLGLRRLAYDWRAEHIPTFDAEVAALQKHGIELTAWWFPAALNDEAKAILSCLERHQLSPQLWVTLGTEPEADSGKLAEKIQGAVTTLAPICDAAAKLGGTVGLYNHLGWFGEPTNQVVILERLRAAGHTNVGSVYNFHHAHAHIDDFAQVLRLLQPHLLAVNLNGMVWDGDRIGRKITPLGTGDEELEMLRTLQASGWRGPVGLIGHTEEDVEGKLMKELAGLEKLAPLAQQAPAREKKRRTSSFAAAGETGAGPKPQRNAGEPAVSGRDPASQAENDWVDNRWQATDVGPFLASNLRLPDGVLAKGLTIKVGERDEGAVAYDTANGAFRAAWTGGFLQFDPARFGLMGAPKPAGAAALWATSDPGFPGADFHFAGLRRCGTEVVLEYLVNGRPVFESPSLENSPAGPVFVRRFRVDPGASFALTAAHLRGPAHEEEVEKAGSSEGVVVRRDGSQAIGLAVRGMGAGGGNKLQIADSGRIALPVVVGTVPIEFELLLWHGPTNEIGRFRELVQHAPPVHPFPATALPATPRWGPALTTHGQRGPDTDFLAVDTLTMPYDNPFKALLFAAGVDLTPEGAAYVCTIHGDVWRVTGIDDSLRELKWQRFATGLFQPLGLKVRDGQVFVLGRDRITRLHDDNGDGEADFYESFFDGIETSTGGHDYVTCLEKDVAGNFYYTDPKGVHRVSADGRRAETLATGFRNPNGLGVSPDGRVITVAPQQGEWTPSSEVVEIKPGGYYGYGGPKITDTRPLGYDAPLLWIPHSVDNSSGSQVWVPPGQWGVFGGQLLHLLWGRCGMMLVLRDDGAPSGGPEGLLSGNTGVPVRENRPAAQGAVVPLPARFLSGPNRASFNPRDGSLYVAGSTGWQTSAVKDGALQRVRFTGKPVALPVAWQVRPEGLQFTFSQPLDRATAEDAGSYSLKRWNYRYAAEYGSKDWSVADPEKEGHDEVPVKSAKLSPDGHSVVLGIPDLKPAMQMELRYNIEGAEGAKPLHGSLWFTVNGIPTQ